MHIGKFLTLTKQDRHNFTSFEKWDIQEAILTIKKIGTRKALTPDGLSDNFLALFKNILIRKMKTTTPSVLKNSTNKLGRNSFNKQNS